MLRGGPPPLRSIQVALPTGNSIDVDVMPDNTIQEVKAIIDEHLGIPIARQCLVWKGSLLQDGFTLRQCRVDHQGTLRMTLAHSISEVCPRDVL